MSNALDQEVDRNFDALLAQMASLLPKHRGEFAVMRDGRVVGYHSSEHLALAAGRSTYADGLYSVQEITDRPADLGFFSHAIHPRIA